MRGKKGARTAWSTHFKVSEERWIINYYRPDGRRDNERIPREDAPGPDDKLRAETYARRWYATYRKSLSVSKAADSVPKPPTRMPVLRDFYERWRKHRRELLKAGRLRGATTKQDKSIWKIHIEPRFGSVPMDKLDHVLIRSFIRELAAKRANLTVHNVHSVLKTLLDDIDAEGWYALPVNPARHRKVIEALPPRVKRVGKHNAIHLTRPQAEALLRCRFVGVERRLRYLVALLSGLRDGELSALRFDDIKTTEGVTFVDVDKALALVGEKGVVQVQGTKTENGLRPVPLHPLVVDSLAWWRQVGWANWVGRKPKDHDLLFPNADGQPSRPRSADHIRADLVLAGLPSTYGPKKHNIVFHALRATFSTWLEEADVSDSIRARLMGQGGTSTADNWYTAKELARLKKGIDALTLGVTVEELAAYERPAPPIVCPAGPTTTNPAPIQKRG